MSQRRSYSSSNDFNMDDLFRPEPAAQQHGEPEPNGQVQGAPEYLGVPQQAPQPQAPAGDHAPATQYLPPYPTGNPPVGGQPSYGGQEAFGAQPSYGGQQTFGGQTFGGQTFGGQQSYGAPQQPYGAPPVPPAPPAYAPVGQGYAPEGDGRRPSSKLIIGGVVAGCAAAGILVAVLVSGGGDSGGAKPKTTPVAKTGTSAPSTGGAAKASPEMQAQAQALSDLLGTANTSRQAVIGAVGSVKKCEKLPESQQALTQAAAQRDDLVTKLAALKVDQLPSGAQLADQLQKAWQASAGADREYAGWAGDAVAGCDPAKQDSPHLKAGDSASGTATTAKTQASTLWNAIAAQTGLATKGPTEL